MNKLQQACALSVAAITPLIASARPHEEPLARGVVYSPIDRMPIYVCDGPPANALRLFPADSASASDLLRIRYLGFSTSLAAPAAPSRLVRQAQPTQDEPENETGEEPGKQEQDESPPSLDELLGLEGEGETAGEDPAKAELDQALSGEEIGDAFVQAVGLMGNVAERIQTQRDAGVQTQRLQEDVLRRLDQLIASLEQQQQQSSSSSSSSSQQQRQQPNQPQQQQQGQRQPGSESNENADAPQLQEGPLRPDLEPVTAAWGNLPARIRDQLMQGVDDSFSSLYKSMTEAYYKRLAEEASQE